MLHQGLPFHFKMRKKNSMAAGAKTQTSRRNLQCPQTICCFGCRDIRWVVWEGRREKGRGNAKRRILYDVGFSCLSFADVVTELLSWGTLVLSLCSREGTWGRRNIRHTGDTRSCNRRWKREETTTGNQQLLYLSENYWRVNLLTYLLNRQ